MKNVLLMIVLGLFAVGCLDESPLDPTLNNGFDWKCPTTGYEFQSFDDCQEVYECSERCVSIGG